MSPRFEVVPLSWNSQCIEFSEWVSLVTLCLAPLIAHIIAGTVPISNLAKSRLPSWHDRICHYNPVSILWRYAAIVDRRIRAISWSRVDFAASNAIFWTDRGWDGGEHMTIAVEDSCDRLSRTHVEFISVSMLTTVITMLQGVSALYMLIGTLVTPSDDRFHPIRRKSLDLIFFPLAIFGLLRLCAAAWLTDELNYISLVDGNIDKFTTLHGSVEDITELSSYSGESRVSFLQVTVQPRLRYKQPNSCIPSCIFRFVFLLVLVGLWFLLLAASSPSKLVFDPGYDGYISYDISNLVSSIFYFSLLTIAVGLFAFYFFRGHTQSTLIPCVSKTWYKLYTILIMVLAFTLFVVSYIETNKMPMGVIRPERGRWDGSVLTKTRGRSRWDIHKAIYSRV